MKRKCRQNTQNKIQDEGHTKQKIKEQSNPKQEKFSLYLLLETDKTATTDQIKKQYRKLVLKYHPDKNQQDPNARDKFHKLKQAFDILSDPEKKKTYDETGLLESQEFDQKSFQNAYQYFRNMFKKVTKEDIEDFQKEYRFGSMERQDLISYYEQNNGNMVQLIESIPLSTNEDIPRFIEMFESWIKEGVLQKSKFFDKTKHKVRKMRDETEQFLQFQKQKKKQSMSELTLAIRNKNQQHHKDFLTALQEKYGGKNKNKANVQKGNKAKKGGK